MSYGKRNCIEQSKTISKNGRLPIFFSIFVSCLKIYLQHSKILYLTYKIFILNQFLNQETNTHCITCNFIETKQKNSTFLHVFIFLDRESDTIKNQGWYIWKRKFNIVSYHSLNKTSKYFTIWLIFNLNCFSELEILFYAYDTDL